MSHSSIPEVDPSTFEREVLASEVPVLLDFTATWCAPCRALVPVLQKIATDYAGKVAVRSIDGDEHASIAAKYGVKGFPTILAFSKGEVVARHVGVTSRERLLEMVAI